MSFAQSVKEELEGIIPERQHCKIAELMAIMECMARISASGETIKLPSEFTPQLRKCFTLLDKTYNINTDVFIEEHKDSKYFMFESTDFPVKGLLRELALDNPWEHLSKPCCRKAYLRGLFLANGTITDPQKKGYHFEINTVTEERTERVLKILSEFSIEAKVTKRRGQDIVYLKDSESVSDVLNLLGAHTSMMGLVFEKINKDVRNRENRRFNCDMANIKKSATASGRMVEDIMYIVKSVGLEALPEQLRETARLRVEFPEESLTDLGKHFEPEVGKSGINHRLRKISEFAESLRQKGNAEDD